MITLGFRKKSSTVGRGARPRADLFLRLCEQVAQFMHENEEQGLQAFFARDGGLIRLFLMTRAETYDFDLSKKLAEFAAPSIERGLFESATLLPASSEAELEAFFDPTTAVRIEIDHAEFSGTSREVPGER